MGFLLENCEFRELTKELIDNCALFDCNHPDLNDFFSSDSVNYASQLLGKTYCFTLKDNPRVIVAAFTVSNDSIKTSWLPSARKNKVSKSIPRQKHFRSYPAVLVGRLGVHKDYQGKKELKIGGELMDIIKSWFIVGNKTGCRFIVVDAYNEENPLKYYKRNSFQFLIPEEEKEKAYLGISAKDKPLSTRLMYFDLLSFHL